MSSTTTILLPILVGFGMLFWSSMLSEEEEDLKLIFRLFFIPCVWLSLHIATIYAHLDYTADSELIIILSDIVKYTSWLIWIIGAYYIFFILKKLYDVIMNNKTKEASDKYD